MELLTPEGQQRQPTEREKREWLEQQIKGTLADMARGIFANLIVARLAHTDDALAQDQEEVARQIMDDAISVALAGARQIENREADLTRRAEQLAKSFLKREGGKL